jgi:hypothetical protein
VALTSNNTAFSFCIHRLDNYHWVLKYTHLWSCCSCISAAASTRSAAPLSICSFAHLVSRSALWLRSSENRRALPQLGSSTRDRALVLTKSPACSTDDVQDWPRAHDVRTTELANGQGRNCIQCVRAGAAPVQALPEIQQAAGAAFAATSHPRWSARAHRLFPWSQLLPYGGKSLHQATRFGSDRWRGRIGTGTRMNSRCGRQTSIAHTKGSVEWSTQFLRFVLCSLNRQCGKSTEVSVSIICRMWCRFWVPDFMKELHSAAYALKSAYGAQRSEKSFLCCIPRTPDRPGANC